MGKIKEIYIETLNETRDLTVEELRELVKTKNKELKKADILLLDMMESWRLISLIGEMNMHLHIKNK